MKNFRKIKTTFIFTLLLLGLVLSLFSHSEAKDPIYNAFVTVELEWAEGYPEKPIVPRNEVKALPLRVIVNIDTGLTFGAGLFEAYSASGQGALIRLEILETTSWCSAVLQRDLLMTNITERDEAEGILYIHVNENAPAYEEGIIRLQVSVGDLGLIKGDTKVFNLSFKPAYFPIIRTELPESNTKRIDPGSQASFPIQIENAGNAETKVIFEILNLPEGWSATVTDFIILGVEKGSKGIATLTVIPSRNPGYHFDETVITLKIIPAFAYNINTTGTPIYANFIIKSRGFSGSGLEFYIPIALIIIIALALIVRAITKRRK